MSKPSKICYRCGTVTVLLKYFTGRVTLTATQGKVLYSRNSTVIEDSDDSSLQELYVPRAVTAFDS